MQYKTTCSHCGRDYMVNGQPGETIKAICPFCGTKASIVTPVGANANYHNSVNEAPHLTKPERRKKDKPMFWKVTLWFLVIVTILFLIFTILYFVFTAMSK